MHYARRIIRRAAAFVILIPMVAATCIIAGVGTNAAHASTSDVANVSLEVTDASAYRMESGALAYSATVAASGHRGDGQICGGYYGSCYLDLEAKLTTGETQAVKYVGLGYEDPLTYTFEDFGLRIGKVSAFRAAIEGRSSEKVYSTWYKVGDDYPDSELVHLDSIKTSRDSKGELAFDASVTATAFNQPGRFCGSGSCYLELAAHTVDGGLTYSKYVEISGADPLTYHFEGSGIRTAPIDKIRAQIENGAGQTLPGEWVSVSDTYPKNATITITNISTSRNATGGLAYHASLTAQGMTQPGRICQYRDYSSCFYGVVADTVAGETVELRFTDAGPYGDDPVTLQFDGTVRPEEGQIAAIRAYIEGRNGERIYSNSSLVRDWTPRTQAGGGNAAGVNCGCSHADPINAASGEYYENDSDVRLAGVGPEMSLMRTHSSTLATEEGPFGFGTSSNISMKLSVTNSVNGEPSAAVVQQESGSTVAFTRVGDRWSPAPGMLATLTRSSDGSWSFVRKRTETITFDAGGQVTSFTDHSGNTLVVSYSDGTATKLTGSGDRTIALTWSGGHVVKATDSAERSVSYGYDTAGNLTSVTAVNGTVTKYGYDASHYVTSVTKPGGGVTTNTYDSSHRVISQTDSDNRTTTFSYNGSTTTVTAPDGAVTVETYDNGILTKLVEGSGTASARTTLSEYDDMGNLTKQTDPRGKVSTFTYDSVGNVLTKTDPLGRVTRNKYNRFNEVTSTTDALNRTLTNTYDSNGNLLKTTSPSGRTQTWTRNPDGTIATWTNAAGGLSAYTYDAAARQTSVTDPDGRVTKARYNAAGLVVGTTAPGVPEATRALDAAGRVLAVTDPRGKTTTTTYDDDGNVTSVKDPNAHTSSSTYDAAGQELTSTDATGKTTTFTYDPAGRIVTSTSPDDAVAKTTWTVFGQKATTSDTEGNTTTYTYDGSGNLLSSSSAGSTVSSAYDDAGQRTSTTDALGKTTTYGYDDAGQPVTVTDPAGRVTSTTYTGDGELKVVTLPDASTRKYEYDALGNVSAFTNQDGKRATYVFDDAGLRMKKTDVGGISTTYSYDAAGKVATATDGNNTETTFTYDDDGQLTKSTAGSDPSTTYAYDAAGNRTGMTDSTGTSTYGYDAADRLTAETNGAGKRIAYGYDDAGNVSSIAYPGTGKTVTYTRNGSGQVTQVTDWADRTVLFTYDTHGNLASQTAGNGVATVIGYDAADQATSMTATRGADTLAAFGYTYAAAGEVSSAATTGTAIAAATQEYTYDALGQLAGSNAATYDASSAGSLTAAAGSALTYDSAQQVTTLTSPATGSTPATSIAYTYDDAGNRITATAGSTHTEYGYDASGNLNQVTGLDGGAVSYTTDGDGLRATRTHAGHTDELTWSTASSLPLLLDDGTTTYIYGPSSSPVIAIDNASGNGSYLTADLIGTPRLATNDAGDVSGTASYDAYGTPLQHTGTMPALGYTAGLADPDTGLIYLRARSYDPTTGQFTTLDPAVDATGQPYTYAGNNPILNTDPTGLWWGSDAWQWYASNWESGAESVTMTKGGVAVGDFLNGNGGSFVAGVANGISFGLGGAAARLVAPEQQCIVESRSVAYGSGDVVGSIATIPLTAGISGSAAEARATARAADATFARQAGILREANAGRGMFGLQGATRAEAEILGKEWVGPGAKLASDGKTWVSSNGLRQWRPPSYKPRRDEWQSNFESRDAPTGTWTNNGHLDITDGQ